MATFLTSGFHDDVRAISDGPPRVDGSSVPNRNLLDMKGGIPCGCRFRQSGQMFWIAEESTSGNMHRAKLSYAADATACNDLSNLWLL